MAEQDDASKTEDPTSRRLSKGREQGQVASSQEVKHWGMLLGGLFGLMFLAGYTAGGVRDAVIKFVEAPHGIPFDIEHLRLTFANLLIDVLLVVGPLLGLLMLLALAVNVGQFGLLWAPAKLKPETSKLNLLKGMKRIFSIRGIVEFLKGLLKLIIVAVISFGLALPLLEDLPLLPQFEIIQTMERIHLIALWIAAGTIGAMSAIAALDFMYQKFVFTKQMRMTKQEVKDETKQAEGDPQVKARIRRLRMERAMQRMMQAVPKADVVITNPTHYAVALTYDMQSMAAPKLVAKGVDHLAYRIRAVATENEVPVVEDAPLARALYATVELDNEIPPEHYQAVAEIIGYVMRLKGQAAWT